MKLEIEVYKGQQIYYNDDSDKFECDIDINGNVKSPKRGSLKDLRNEIDQFIKLNLEFKPFTFYEKKYGSVTKKYCCAIRKDGSFVTYRQGNENYKSYQEFGDSEEIYVYDADVDLKLTELENELERVKKEIGNKKEQIYSSLAKMDLSQYQI